MVDLNRQLPYFKDQLDEYWERILTQSSFIKGEFVSQIESELGNYLHESIHTISCGNGTDALLLALESLQIPKGRKILTTSFSFVSAAEVILRYGCTPVFIDVDPSTFQIDLDQLFKEECNDIEAIIVVHLFGQSTNMNQLMEFANKKGILVIEDCAQSFGATYEGKKIGTFGVLSTTSFFPSKNLGCFGDGGAVFTQDDHIADYCRMLANHGSKTKYHYEMAGLNSRLDSMQAAVLLSKLPYLNSFNLRRKEAADLYFDLLSDVEIILPKIESGAEHIFHQFTIRCERRDELKSFLKRRKIPSMIYYPIPIHKTKVFQENGQIIGNLEQSEKISNQVLSLPMHPELKASEIRYICKSIKEFYNQ